MLSDIAFVQINEILYNLFCVENIFLFRFYFTASYTAENDSNSVNPSPTINGYSAKSNWPKGNWNTREKFCRVYIIDLKARKEEYGVPPIFKSNLFHATTTFVKADVLLPRLTIN